jgi:hypothetical protein
MKKIYLTVIAVLFVATAILWASEVKKDYALGSAQDGLYASLQSSATTTVNTAVSIKIFDASTSCNARIIDAPDTDITITLGNPSTGIASSSLDATIAHVRQSGTTTVAYDSGIYGCGEWWAYAGATTTLNVTEF